MWMRFPASLRSRNPRDRWCYWNTAVEEEGYVAAVGMP